MKKILLSLSLIGILGGLISIVSANTTSCKNVYFANGVTACVNIEKIGTDRRSFTTNFNGGSTSSLKCDIMLPDSNLRSISSCNGEFFYDIQKLGRIKLWIRYNEGDPTDRRGKPNNNSEWTYPQWIYDFDNEGRGADNLQDTMSSSSSTDLNNFYLNTDDSMPSASQYIDLTVKARDIDNYTLTDFSDSINFKVYYRTSDSYSWTQTTSSMYYTMNSSYTNGYDFTSSDNGQKTFTNFIKFNKNNYDYKVRVYDENDSSIYKEITFNVGSTDTSNTLNNFYLTTNDSTPYTYQYVNLTIKARDISNYTLTKYTDPVNFKVYYRASSSSSWIQTTSPTYYTINSNYTNGYDFRSSDYGIANFTNFIKFNKNNYDYKVRVYDENNTSIYKEIIFNVGYTNGSTYINGFTSSEITTVQGIYNGRDKMINDLKNRYSILKTNAKRQNMSDNIKYSAQEIINNNSTKKYDNFTDFYAAFLDWYRYTISVR